MTITRTAQLRDAIPDAPTSPAPNGAATVATRKPDPAGDLIASMESEFRKLLPSALPWDMFARIALTGMRKNDKLIEATRPSLLGALMECARLGLAPCTEQASLSTFKNRRRGNVLECQLIIGYQGYIQLMYRSGQVEQVEAEMVYEADEWEYTLGDGGRFFHRPKLLLPPEERGAPLFAYAYATLRGGGRTKVSITPRWKAEELRKKHGNVWDSNFLEMWGKTPLRQVQKYAPKSSELRRAELLDGAVIDLGGVATLDDGRTIDSTVVDEPTGAVNDTDDDMGWPPAAQPADANPASQ
ncbi:recombination protein RecT [Micromonospora pisi]|uniref:Recombination protein RecT n=1 Tax=Micromonospora pisi TaxID=589240 RepID=A0A495JV03_9ACTN|nr:recombinase RecT [Micromonospora pisi]RKR92846.1 recombination protein RecT [Micromonospora pisi]